MKKIRTVFYSLSAWASGLCLITMTLLILAQIVARLIGVIIPSSEDFAGWLLSATIFFGLAYTFNIGGHIRVTILLSRLSLKVRHYLEYINLFIALGITAYLAYYTVYTVYESYIYEEVTDTYLAMPLWLVQLPMSIGSVFLFLAILDSFITMLLGKRPNYIDGENELESEG